MKQRLLLLFCSILCSLTALSQHPHSHDGGPFYWALVGGIAAAMWYVLRLVFGNFKHILSLIQKIRRKKNSIIQNHISQDAFPVNNSERSEVHQINSRSKIITDSTLNTDNTSSKSNNNDISISSENNEESKSNTSQIVLSEPIDQDGTLQKKTKKRKTIIWIMISCFLIVAIIGFILYNNERSFSEFHDIREYTVMKPLDEINRMMSLNGLSDRERELWYKVNEQQLAKYSRNPRLYARAADQMYKNQLFKQKFGQAEFDKTYGMPGGAALRNQQLENRLVEEVWIKTFGPKR